MHKDLFSFLLKNIEASPDATFYESELRSYDSSDFDALCKKKYLKWVPYDPEHEPYYSSCCGDSGNERFIRHVNGKIYAYSSEDSSISRIELKQEDINRWSFAIDKLVAEIKGQNDLYKNSGTVSVRLFFIGAKDVVRERVGVYLGLFADEEHAEGELLSLKARTDQYHKYYVICPTYELKSQDLLSRLVAEKITCLPFRECFTGSGYVIDFSKLKGKGGLSTSTNEQILETTAYDYNCEDKIHIPAIWPRKSSNIVEVNNSPIRLGDSLFKLLLRLVVGAKQNKKKGGWVKFDIMPGEHQPFSNLRTPLKGALISKDGETFIESDGKMKYRLSTHPDNISYNRETLLNHPSAEIKALAKKLPGG